MTITGNTKHFHLMANRNILKTRSFRIEQDEGVIKGDENLKKFITRYHKYLFGELTTNNFSMVQSAMCNNPQLPQLKNKVLMLYFL